MKISAKGIKVLHRLGLSRYLNIYPKTTIGSSKIKIPILKGIGVQNLEISEPWMMDLFTMHKGYFNNGTFLDVGFNVGQTLIKYRSLFRDTQYVGFDPNPVCNFYVKELVQSNKWQNVRLIPAGISEQNNIAKLYLYEQEDEDSSASIIDGFRSNMPVTQILHIPVFDVRSMIWLKEITSSVSCIKIDVEGGELEVIRSCAGIITEKRPLILIEILPVYTESNKVRLERQLQVEALLRNLNYECNLISKTDKGTLKSLIKIDAIGINTDINHCDYLYSPSEFTF